MAEPLKKITMQPKPQALNSQLKFPISRETILSLFPFFFPFYLIRFSIFGLPSNLLEIAFVAFVLILLFEKPLSIKSSPESLAEDSSNPSKIQNPKSSTFTIPLLFPLTLFVLAGILGVAIATWEDVSLRKSLGWWKGFIFFPAAFFVFLANISAKTRQNLYKNFVLSSALLGFLSFFSFEAFTDDGRLSGFFESANFLAFSLAPALLVFLYLREENLRQKKSRKLTLKEFFFEILVFLGIAVPLFLTQSYLSIFAIAFLVFVWKALEFIKKGKIDKKIILITLAVLTAFVFSFYHTEKFQTVFDLENRSSISVRKEVYTVSSHFLLSHPFFGIGLANYEDKYLKEAPLVLGHAPFEWTMRHTHNLILSFWLNLGFPGFVVLLWFFYLVIREGFSANCFLKIMPFLYFALHGTLDTPFWKNDVSMIFFLCLALALFEVDSSSQSEHIKNEK